MTAKEAILSLIKGNIITRTSKPGTLFYYNKARIMELGTIYGDTLTEIVKEAGVDTVHIEASITKVVIHENQATISAWAPTLEENYATDYEIFKSAYEEITAGMPPAEEDIDPAE